MQTGALLDKVKKSSRAAKAWLEEVGHGKNCEHFNFRRAYQMYDAERVHASQVTMARKVIIQPGILGGTILPTHLVNGDRVTVVIDMKTNTWRLLPEGYKHTFKVTAVNEMGFVMKNDIVFSAFGDTITLISLIQDEKLPEGEIMKFEVTGWGPSDDFVGHIWVVPKHSGKQYVKESFKDIVMPAFDKYTSRTIPRQKGVTEARVYACDGEMTQTAVFCSEEMKQFCKDHQCSIFKLHTCLSWGYQINDTSTLHRSTHNKAKSGAVAHLFDVRVLEDVQQQFEAEVKRIQSAHPQEKGKWHPSRNVLTRLKRGITILQPVWRSVLCDQRAVRKGVAKAGWVVKGAKTGIQVNERVLQQKFPKLATKTPAEWDEYKETVKRIEKRVHADPTLYEVPETLMTEEGLHQMPDIKKIRADPQRSQPEDKLPYMRRAMILTVCTGCGVIWGRLEDNGVMNIQWRTCETCCSYRSRSQFGGICDG